MQVYNLTERPIDFHGRTIPPNGGSVSFPELDSFIPDRDQELERARVLSFGHVPEWWKNEQRLKANFAKPAVVVKRLVEDIAVEETVSFKTKSSATDYRSSGRK
jgi:hypothetical protein